MMLEGQSQRLCVLVCLAATSSCVDVDGMTQFGSNGTGTRAPNSSGAMETSEAEDSATASAGSTRGPATSTTTSADETGDGPKLDLSIPDINVPPSPPPPPVCHVVDDMDAVDVDACNQEAPPDSFEPDIQWTWDGGEVIVNPLVANLTDDNGDGSIDLCDTPDVVISTYDPEAEDFVMHVLDGATGAEQFQVGPIGYLVSSALADIDGDGEVEILTARPEQPFQVFWPWAFVAFDTDGTELWSTDYIWDHRANGAIGVADFDNDGSPEIYGEGIIVSAQGEVLLQAPPEVGWWSESMFAKHTASTAADLDGDDDLELILGKSAYHHDGSVYYEHPTLEPGFPQVANLDDDPQPEILLNNPDGITVLEHDGTIKFRDMTPIGADETANEPWWRPSTIHDFDGDGVAEFALATGDSYSVFEADLSVHWTRPIQDFSGIGGGTAFDFLGDGTAEAMYSDETTLFIFDGDGTPELQVPRSSRTAMEYPIVVDVDNDGSAEIIVVSSEGWDLVQSTHSVQVIRDVEDRWIQARRIWNQHTYHVTNVREDGTIPAVEPRSWELLNTFRTNAQIENGVVCEPRPEG